ncbi:MAG TPA: M1 family metallopeptidase [Dissulfurispiraceae bacterium]|nr:M1 family metallopeptidase [Dissulfurispiraceae bacterium]
MAEKNHKYRRENFAEMPLKLEHMTMYINFIEDRVDATNCLEMTARCELHEIVLDAKELSVHAVFWANGADDIPLNYDYRKEHDKLCVTLPRPVKAGERFSVRTVTSCVPTDHLLEGIYKDTTQDGAPQQYMSQCQQWGFQRIMPVFDDCTAKCTMTTTIEADSRYTHLISNGNISRTANPGGTPVPKPGDPSRQIIAYENLIPMAPYLFLVCAGTWDMLVDSVVYPSGRRVRLEYLVPPGMTGGVRIPMEILKESILWIQRTQDYEYRGETYRTICMNKSNFGGMENVGNTTIVTDAAVIDDHTLDSGLMYAHAVIVHEFEHNQCGSETTMATPFDVWLNEAYTVDVERQFMADNFNPAFVRLNQVESIRNPLLGPLAIEDSGYAGRIVREGFNDPEELIDGVTYVKAAEVIRMIRLILGRDVFAEAKRLYFSRYRNGNADTEEFFACFEEVSGIALKQFREGWLYRAGYPNVSAETSYDAARQQYAIRFDQKLAAGQMPFHLPIELALVDALGNDIPGTATTFQLREASAELTLDGIREAPAFASLNRDYSFYGTLLNKSATTEVLALQAQLDGNVYSRVEAFRQLTDSERINLMEDRSAHIGRPWLRLYGEMLNDNSLPPSVKAFMLRIDEQPLDRAYIPWYQERVAARELLMKAVNAAYRQEILKQFAAIDTYSSERQHSPKDGIEDRMLKNMLLELIAVDDMPQSHSLLLEHYHCATTATDRVAALALLNRSSEPSRRAILGKVYEEWHSHLSGYANYLRIVAGGTCSDVFEMIEEEKRRMTFDITQPTWQRALFMPMAINNRMVWSDAGIRWLTETIIALAPINMTTTSRLLNTFQQARNLRPGLKEKGMTALARIADALSDRHHPAIHNQAKAYMKD